jgi:hypothetical protein
VELIASATHSCARSEFGLATEGRRLLFLFSLLMIVVAVEMLRRRALKS